MSEYVFIYLGFNKEWGRYYDTTLFRHSRDTAMVFHGNDDFHVQVKNYYRIYATL
jgi:hypothetical protein